MAHLCLDISTAAIPGVETFLDAGDEKPPANYKDPEKIAAWQEEKRQERINRAGLDLDLSRITGVATWQDGQADVWLCPGEVEEKAVLTSLAQTLHRRAPSLITYNGHSFDCLVLMRRARYLGVKFPTLSTDRFKSTNVDLLDVLTHKRTVPAKSLGWYVKRLGWTDLVKPLSGADEARVPETGQWDELRASLAHDVEAVARLATWLGVLEPVAVL